MGRSSCLLTNGRAKIALALAIPIGALTFTSGAAGQTRACTTTTYSDPPRQVFFCPNGLTITAESGASYRLIDRNNDGRPEAVELNGRGVLVDARRGGFQVLTPHAVASVRGTIWAVDVGPDRSSVFVREGSVMVARRAGGVPPVTLGPGDGVDVDDGGGPLTRTRWGVERAAGLMARFGR